MNQIKKNKLLIISFSLISIFLLFNNNVFGALTTPDMHSGTPAWLTAIFNGLNTILSIGVGALTAPLISLGFALLMCIFILLYFLFSPVTGGNGSFPFPDQIIFNRLAFFDPNFMNPSTAAISPTNLLQDLIKNMFFTCFTIATSVFILAALLIGIKLAVSTIASEKAHYKQALNNWIFGIVLIFILPFLIYGIFYINELIVQKAYDVVKDAKVIFKVPATDIASVVGLAAGGTVGMQITKAVGGFVNWVSGGSLNDVAAIEFEGYGGMIFKYMVSAAAGNLVGLVICGILIGQTAALIFLYIKRLLYCILLGMVAPLIIAADVLKQNV